MSYPDYIPALDYIIYGYHDSSSVWKLQRLYSYGFYTFKQMPGNALFVKVYGIFGSIFGPKGFVFNSSFLIFSLLGIRSSIKGGLTGSGIC